MPGEIGLDLVVTAALLAAGLAGGTALIWLERKPRPLGEPRLLPTTSLLFVCALIVVLALAHLVSLVTGAPHVGRFGTAPIPFVLPSKFAFLA